MRLCATCAFNPRCFNAPHLWRLGWSNPLAVLNGSSFPPGVWFRFALPATVLNDSNHVQVRGREAFTPSIVWMRASLP